MENKNKLILAYNKLKVELDNQRHSETLKKYYILSKAYKLGKKIYGQKFSIIKLSIDFQIPFTTCKRILSLDKANINTWKKIKSGKISSFKVAQLLLHKNTTYQDEFIDLIIEKNLSTYEISKLRARSLKDIQKLRLRKAVEEGFVRKESAYCAWIRTLERVEDLCSLDKNNLPKSKLSILKNKLNYVKNKIEEYGRTI